MFKLLKYDLIGSFKHVLVIICSQLLAFIFILSKIGKWNNEVINAFLFMTVLGGILTILLYIIQLYEKELYEDRRYLTFTLPLKSNKILGSKLILSVILCLISMIISSVFILIIQKHICCINVKGILFNHINTKEELFSFINSIIQILLFVITIFISITLTKMISKNKKLGFLSLIFFMLISILLGCIKNKILNGSLNVNVFFQSNGFNCNIYKNNGDKSYIRLISTLWDTMNIGIMFLVTSYIVDKKMDL